MPVVSMGMVKCLIGLFVGGLLNLKQVNYMYEHLKDAARQGRPATVLINNNIVKIHQFLQKDVRYTLRQLACVTNLLARVHGILKKSKDNDKC